MLQPDQGCIKPKVDVERAAELIKKLYGLSPEGGVDGIKEFVSYDDKNFFFRPEKRHRTEENKDIFYEDGYILKIANILEDPEALKAQNELMLHLHKKKNLQGIPRPINNQFGTHMALEPQDQEISRDAEDEEGSNQENVKTKKKLAVRLLTFIPGKTLYSVRPWTTKHFYQCGRLLAQFIEELKDFKNETLSGRKFIWQLSSVPNLRGFLNAVKDDFNRQICTEVIDSFDNDVLQIADKLEKGVIHGDFNEQNILVRLNKDVKKEEGGKPDELGENYDVFGVIDFGDSHENPYIFDLATTIMYMMTQCEVIDPNLAGEHVIAGYKTVRQITSTEMDILKICAAARYVQSLVLGAYTNQQDPSNEYVLITAQTGWRNLRRFWEAPKEELYKQWEEIAGAN